ncbi:tyrosine--tRNA ligase, partial [Candidatus Kaiserbacteria bacterium]|nr:tyrosine--tRNA ligase [Candidatus Kaiserbacteria bacterium]
GLLVLRRFLEDGHKVILLTGGGTGMIGDPGGKSEERNLLDEETIQRNSKAVAAQIRTVFGTDDFIEENNAKWLTKLHLLEFLRDIGKYFTVNSMIKKDIVKDRLDAESPISFTEFSYSLLQGFDYLHLNKEYGCDVQVGGSDQWSNILAGVEFIRRKEGKEVFALTWPLIVNKATGKKFGKSESGAIWLDAKKTSPFQMYQFFLNVEDDAVEELLLKLTLLSWGDIESHMKRHLENASERLAQRVLAREVTALVHGHELAARAERVTQVLFSNTPISSLSEEEIRALKESVSSFIVTPAMNTLDVIVESGLATSKTEARRYTEDGAVRLDDVVVDGTSNVADMIARTGGIGLLKRGKRNVCVVTLA